MIKPILSVVLLTISLIAIGQTNSNHLLTGPEGAVIQLAGWERDARDGQAMHFLPAGVSLSIYKTIGNSNNRKIATVTFPVSAKEMQQRLGQDLTNTLVQQLKVPSAEAAYTRLVKDGPAALGLLLFVRQVMEAFGLVYVDKTWTKGQVASYAIEVNEPAGKRMVARQILTTEARPGYDSTIRFKLSKFSLSDSTMTSLWSAKLVNGRCYFAQPMRSEGSNRTFLPTPQLAMVFQEKDSLYVQYNEMLTPGARVNYLIRPADWAGNLGLPSDTLHVLAVNAHQLAGITGLTVRDTLNGLLLQWDALPKEAVYAGIQILKSRQIGSDYVILDTLAATATSYLDTRLLPNVDYFYRIAPVLFRLPGKEPPPFAEAAGAMLKATANNIPQEPIGVRASIVAGKIKVQWDPSPDVNIFGYYVLRGTSKESLSVISGVVKIHEYWDTLFSPNYSGAYLYAVKAVSQNQQESGLSALSSVSIRQPVILPAPGGIIARRRDGQVYLEWDHSYYGEQGITGYYLYARKTGERQFRLLTATPITRPFYVDSTNHSQPVEYAVTTTDVWGNQSILSPLSAVGEELAVTVAPPATVTLGNRPNGIAISWPVPYETDNIKYCIYRKLVTRNHLPQDCHRRSCAGVYRHHRAKKQTV